jgi:hypothetical protein
VGVRVLGHLSPLYSGAQATNVKTKARFATLRVATAAEVKRVLLYLLAGLWVEGDLAYRYPAFEAGTGALQASVPSTMRSPDDARWRFRAPDLSTVRNSLLRCYPEGEIAIDCPSKD